MDSSGFIYVSDIGNNRVQKFTADGQFVTKWGSQVVAMDNLTVPWV